MLDEVEHGGLGPVDVVEGGDERAAACERLEEPAHGPLDVHLGRARPGPSRCRRDARRHRLRLGVAREEVFDLGHAGGPRQVVHDLDQRPVGDALAVRKAAADDHRRLRLDSGDELLEDPGLADPRGACDGDEHAAAAVDGPAETGVQHPQLGPPAHQRHGGSARVAPRRIDQPLHLPHPKRPRLALGVDRAVRSQPQRHPRPGAGSGGR